MAPPPHPDKVPAERRQREVPGADFRPAGRVSRSRMVALFMLGLVLFTPPLLDAFDRPATLLGLPAIFLYVFGAWAGVVVLIALSLERRR